jgi:hypothetical protein
MEHKDTRLSVHAYLQSSSSTALDGHEWLVISVTLQPTYLTVFTGNGAGCIAALVQSKSQSQKGIEPQVHW